MSHEGRAGAVLVIDTATSRVVIATGTTDGAVDDVATWEPGYRHGETLLPSIARVLGEANTGRSQLDANIGRSQLGAIVVGTGPGAFTGLRVGIATAKGLAHGLAVPLVGVSTAEALMAAAATPRPVLLLPAGPSDRVLVRPGEAPRSVRGGLDPELDPGETLIAVDLVGRAPSDAVTRGDEARAGLASALLSAGVARLRAYPDGELATLVPEYVTPPRGARPTEGTVTWSRDHR